MSSASTPKRDSWAIITGASGGLGLAFARELARRGHSLILAARSQPRLEAAAQALAVTGVSVRVVPLDLSQPDAPSRLVAQTDAWDVVPEVLINNAGCGDWGRFLDRPLEPIDAMVRLNVSSLVQLSHHYGRRMRDRRHGYLLQVASTAAFQPVPSYAAYAATKAFVLSFSRALDYEARKHGISSTALCPGPTDTDFFRAAGQPLNAIFRAILLPPERVARQGIDAMFRRRAVHVPGLVNKLTAAAPRILPARWMARAAALFTH
jgi:short-subunit dehydrogenase